MRRFGLTPLLVLAAIATAILVAGRYTPYFPGDVDLARFIQAWVPAGAVTLSSPGEASKTTGARAAVADAVQYLGAVRQLRDGRQLLRRGLVLDVNPEVTANRSGAPGPQNKRRGCARC